MRRAALALTVVPALAACGGSASDRPAPAERASVVSGEVRSPDARSPRFVLVDLRDGDLTVRAAAGGRFVAGAAVSDEHLDVGGYWTAGCERVA